MNLQTDEDRAGCKRAGITMRAVNTDGRYVEADLCELSDESAIYWLSQRTGIKNVEHERIFLALLNSLREK